MRILNEDSNKSMKNALLLLTVQEASELRDDLERLISQKIFNDHSHINDSDYEHELTIALYNPDNIEEFNERTKKLISHDE
jgi:hypothetical protein